ncbi:MAG: hypothetical protein WC685_14740 [Methylobacter sp.]|jgi:hypothetical protein
MKANIQLLIGMAFIALTACSTQEVKQDTLPIPATDNLATLPDNVSSMSGQNPPLTLVKGNKTLNLVRIMDGGACKNDEQGVKGTFLVYADPTDIDRIKRDKGPQIFSDFESKIQFFSSNVLQDTINATNLAEDPFTLGADEAQQKLANQLTNNFRNAVADSVNKFQKETTLTIDIVPFIPSFVFYQRGCEATHVEPEN